MHANNLINSNSKSRMHTLFKLAYQPVLLHRLIRVNIEIRLIANNYNYLFYVFFHLLNILTNILKYKFIII